MTNVKATPSPGDIWTYHSVPYTDMADWRIAEVQEDAKVVQLIKLTEPDVGYSVWYPLITLTQGKAWQPKMAKVTSITFHCPGCNDPAPISVGDYLCKTCRSTLDQL